MQPSVPINNQAFFYKIMKEVIKTPFSLDQMNLLRPIATKLEPAQLVFINFLLSAKQAYSASLKGRLTKLTQTQMGVLAPLVPFTALLAGKTEEEEQPKILLSLYEMLFKQESPLGLAVILKPPLCPAMCLKVTEGLLCLFINTHDLSLFQRDESQIVLMEIFALWKSYPGLYAEVHKKPFILDPQVPFNLHPYFKSVLLLHQVGTLDASFFESFKPYLRSYAQNFAADACPTGFMDGWSLRFLALREVAMVYMLGLDLEVWGPGVQGETHQGNPIDATFPGFTGLLKSAAFDYVDQQDVRYVLAEWFVWDDFLGFEDRFAAEAFVLPLRFKQVVLILEVISQVNQPFEKQAIVPLVQFLMELDGLLAGWETLSPMQGLIGQAWVILQGRKIQGERGFKPFLHRFFASTLYVFQSKAVFEAMIRLSQGQKGGILQVEKELQETIVQAALLVLPLWKQEKSSCPILLDSLLPKDAPSFALWRAQLKGPAQKDAGNFIVMPGKRKDH